MRTIAIALLLIAPAALAAPKISIDFDESADS